MLPSESTRVALFLIAIIAVYVAAGACLLRLAVGRYRKLGPDGPGAAGFTRSVLAVAGLGLACMLYGGLIEPNWLDVSQVAIASPKLRGAQRPIRILHLSDIHSDPAPRLETKLPQVIASLRPDLILFSGDSINSPEGLPVFRTMLSKLSSIAPTYAVRGNWDAWYWSELDLFGATGAKELRGEAVRLNVAGAKLFLAGTPVQKEEAIRSVLSKAPAEFFSILLYHYPDEIGEAARWNTDLYLAGHTHGGQVALPFYGALMTLSRFDKLYEAGLYKVQNTSLYVSRGIGMEGGPFPRVRFWARPQITLLELSGS